MAHTLRPLSLGGLLDETFYIYRNNFLLFLTISALPNLGMLLLTLGVAAVASNSANGGSLMVGVLAIFGGISALFAKMFVTALVTAATTLGVSDIYLNRETSARACFSRVTGKTLKVVGVSILVGIIVGVGMLLLVIPGIYWAGLYALAIPAVVLEDVGAGPSLSRSSELTKGAVWRMIVIYFMTTIFALIIGGSLAAGVDALSPAFFTHTGMITKDMLKEILTAISASVFGPVTAIGLTLAYYDRRIRKEAFDIQHMMDLMSAPETQAVGTSA